MGNTSVLINTDGKIEYLPSYILLKPNKSHDSIELLSDASIYELGLATIAVYDTFIETAAKYSDQDIFEVCKAINLDYSIISNLVKEYRINE